MALYLLPARAQLVNRAVLQFRSLPRFKPSSPLHGYGGLFILKTIFRKIHLANSSWEQRRLVKQRPKLGWWFIGSLLLVAISLLLGFGYITWTPYKFGR